MPALLRSALTLCIVSIIAACESGNDGGSLNIIGQDNTPPSLAGTIPTITTEEPPFETDQALTLLFSELVDEDSISQPSMTPPVILEQKFSDIEASDQITPESPLLKIEPIAFDFEDYLAQAIDPLTGESIDSPATRLRISPANKALSLDSAYLLTIDRNIKDLSSVENINPVTGIFEPGNFLETAANLSFRTKKGNWGAQELLSNGPGTDITNFGATRDRLENTRAVWTEINQAYEYSLHSSQYDNDTGAWTAIGTNTGLSSIVTTNISSAPILSAQIAVANQESTLVAWIENSNQTGTNIGYLSINNGGSWQTLAGALTTPASNSSIKSLDIISLEDNSYRAYWIEENANGSSIWFQEVSLDSAGVPTLGTATELLSSTINTLQELHIEPYASRVVVIWQAETPSLISSINAAVHVDGPAFLAGSLFSTAPGLSAESASFALNEAGEGLLSWSQLDSSLTSSIWHSKFSLNQFTSPSLVEQNDIDSSDSPSSSSCFNANNTIFWLQRSGNLTYIVSRTQTLNGWKDVITHDRVVTTSNIELSSYSDRSCNIIATWHIAETDSVRTSYFSQIDQTWSDAEDIQKPFTSRSTLSSDSNSLHVFGDSGRLIQYRIVESDGHKQIATSVFDEQI